MNQKGGHQTNQFTRPGNGGYTSNSNIATGGGSSGGGGQRTNFKRPVNAQDAAEENTKKKMQQLVDFITYPFGGEPTRVAALQKQILQEARDLNVIQELDGGGESVLPADGCFLTKDFYYLYRDFPKQPIHLPGEDEQTKRDIDAEIVNWKLNDAGMKLRNESMTALWKHFSAESTGWLRKRIQSEYWASLQTT